MNRGDNFLVSQCTNVQVSERQTNPSEGYSARRVTSSAEAWDTFVKDIMGPNGSGVDTAAEVARLTTDLDRWDHSASTKRLETSLPKAEGIKLQQLATTFRLKQEEIRRRLAQLSKPASLPPSIKGFPARVDTDPNPDMFLREKSDLLAKVMSLALAINRTQVVVWQTFDQIGTKGLWYDQGRNPDFHNSIGHGPGDKSGLAARTWEVYNIEMQMFANLMLELKSIPEGNGTVLDSTLIVTYSDMCNGVHNHTIPAFTLLAGGRNGRFGGGALKLGKYVRLPLQRANNDLLLTVSHLLGVDTIRDSGGSIVPFDSIGNTQHCKGLVREIFT
jgi:hypothetical protein